MAATGEPVMCTMVLEMKTMKGGWVMGLKMFAETVRSVSD